MSTEERMKRVRSPEGPKRNVRHEEVIGEDPDLAERARVRSDEVSRGSAEPSEPLSYAKALFRTPRTSLSILAALIFTLAGAVDSLMTRRRAVVHLLVALLVIIIIVLVLILLTDLGIL